jgi:crotonobetainyl-CoA:carnitine CoA-transferase CaiB-like acyl-CoA transferase
VTDPVDEPSGGARPGAGSGPLAGLKVLELATLYAGPLISAMLGDLGADVVKVEPPEGEPFRALVGRDEHAGPGVWTLVSRNKRMVTVDHRRPGGTEVLERLTAAADIVVVNQPATVLEQMNCSYAAISARNPAAIVVNVTGWGDGPNARRGGNGTVAEAFGGLTHVLAGGGEPTLSPALLGDCLTALSGAVGALAACYWRAVAGGEGQYVEIPMFEAVMTAVAPQIVSYDPDRPSPTASGLRQILRTGDGHRIVATAYTPAQVVRLLDAVGVESAPADDASSHDGERLTALVGDWVARHDLGEVMDAFADARIPATPVNDIAGVLADPHVQARGVVRQVETAEHGAVAIPRPAPRLSRTPSDGARFAQRSVGADTDEVFAEWLGLSDIEIDHLRTQRVV